MTSKDREVNPPSATLLALEGRGLFDMASLATAAPFLTLAPRGTRHAVIVLPGLGADDRSTVAIRGFLSSLGYDVHGWSLGRNVRPSGADMPAILAQISRLRAATNLPVSLVGWSRGGIMAREAAREIPAAVRMVITLGSPFAAPGASNAGRIWRLLTGDATPTPERMKLLAKPIPVPATSIYTRSDGVVAWQACLEEEGPRRENIEVRTTHIGLGFHPPALWAIADRLSQPIGEWRPFRPSPLVAGFFPGSGST